MAISGKQEVDIEVKSNADLYWGTFRNFITVFPKVYPNEYKSIDILEGDGKSVGSVCRHNTYGEAGSLHATIERIEAVDDAKKTLSYIVIGGDLYQDYKKFKGYVGVTPKGDKSVVKWAIEYEKASQEVLDPSVINDVKGFLELDAYIQNK